MPLIVVINVVVVLAIGLVLYFVLRPKPPVAAPAGVAPATTPATPAPK
jgi:hypothetical protein